MEDDTSSDDTTSSSSEDGGAHGDTNAQILSPNPNFDDFDTVREDANEGQQRSKRDWKPQDIDLPEREMRTKRARVQTAHAGDAAAPTAYPMPAAEADGEEEEDEELEDATNGIDGIPTQTKQAYVPEETSWLAILAAKALRTSQKKPSTKRIHAAPYNEQYRKLLNEAIDDARTRNPYSDHSKYYSAPTLIAGSLWTQTEKDAFFRVLPRVGKDNVEALSSEVITKSPLECRAYVCELQQATLNAIKGDYKTFKLVTLAKIPAAVEISEECIKALDLEAARLEQFTVKKEMLAERKTYGDFSVLNKDDGAALQILWEDGAVEAVKQISPAAELLNLDMMMELSLRIFMAPHREPTDDERPKSKSKKDIDPLEIRQQAFMDLQTLVVSLTRRIVQVSLYQAHCRLQLGAYSCEPVVKRNDVRAAIMTLGLDQTSEAMWQKIPRKYGLTILANEPAPVQRMKRPKMEYDAVEKELAVFEEVKFGVEKEIEEDFIRLHKVPRQERKKKKKKKKISAAEPEEDAEENGEETASIVTGGDIEELVINDELSTHENVEDSASGFELERNRDETMSHDSGQGTDANESPSPSNEDESNLESDNTDVQDEGAVFGSVSKTNSTVAQDEEDANWLPFHMQTQLEASVPQTLPAPLTSEKTPRLKGRLRRHERHIADEEAHLESLDKLASLKCERALWSVLGVDFGSGIAPLDRQIAEHILIPKPGVFWETEEEMRDWRDSTDAQPIWRQDFYREVWEAEGKGRRKRISKENGSLPRLPVKKKVKVVAGEEEILEDDEQVEAAIENEKPGQMAKRRRKPAQDGVVQKSPRKPRQRRTTKSFDGLVLTAENVEGDGTQVASDDDDEFQEEESE